jgi:hypothetical protein
MLNMIMMQGVPNDLLPGVACTPFDNRSVWGGRACLVTRLMLNTEHRRAEHSASMLDP